MFSMKIEAPWEENPVLAELTAQMPTGQPPAEFRKFAFGQPGSQGRNEPCACGSGKNTRSAASGDGGRFTRGSAISRPCCASSNSTFASGRHERQPLHERTI